MTTFVAFYNGKENILSNLILFLKARVQIHDINMTKWAAKARKCTLHLSCTKTKSLHRDNLRHQLPFVKQGFSKLLNLPLTDLVAGSLLKTMIEISSHLNGGF